MKNIIMPDKTRAIEIRCKNTTIHIMFRERDRVLSSIFVVSGYVKEKVNIDSTNETWLDLDMLK